MEKLKKLLPINLQFFAEEGGSDDSGADNGSNGNEGGNQDQNSGEKTFTQSQVSAMMAKEKNEGKRSILKSLGFKDENEAKAAVNAYNAFINSGKTDEQKNADDVNKANEEKNESLARAIAAENKLTCFEIGVNKDSVDDVLAIANTKVTDSKDLKTVLEEMKKDNRYSSFFKEDDGSSNSGTGVTPGHSKGASSPNIGELGKRLGEKNALPKDNKSSFF